MESLPIREGLYLQGPAMKRRDTSVAKRSASIVLLLAIVFGVGGCYVLHASRGGGQVRFQGVRSIDPGDVAVPEGYRVEVVADGLTYPTGIAIADDGTLYVTEAGYAYGAEPGRARLLEIAPDGSSRVLAESDNPPWNGITLNDGVLYVAGGHVREGEVLRVSMEGRVTPLVTELPSLGDPSHECTRDRPGWATVLLPGFGNQCRGGRRRQS